MYLSTFYSELVLSDLSKPILKIKENIFINKMIYSYFKSEKTAWKNK